MGGSLARKGGKERGGSSGRHRAEPREGEGLIECFGVSGAERETARDEPASERASEHRGRRRDDDVGETERIEDQNVRSKRPWTRERELRRVGVRRGAPSPLVPFRQQHGQNASVFAPEMSIRVPEH